MNTQKAPFKWVSTATGILSYFTRNTQKGNERLTCVCCLEQLRAGDVATGGGNLGWNLGWYRAAAGAHRHCRGFLYSRQQESHTVRMAGGSVRARAPPVLTSSSTPGKEEGPGRYWLVAYRLPCRGGDDWKWRHMGDIPVSKVTPKITPSVFLDRYLDWFFVFLNIVFVLVTTIASSLQLLY